jgi:hypothetical protein
MPANPGVYNGGVSIRGLVSLPAPATTEMLTVDAAGNMSRQAIPVASLGGATGSNDNRILRADGTGGATVQSSAITIDDSGNISGIARATANAYDVNVGGALTWLSGFNENCVAAGVKRLANQAVTQGVCFNVVGEPDTLTIRRLDNAQPGNLSCSSIIVGDLRNNSGIRIRNYANNANAPVICSEIDFGSNLGFDRKIIPRSYGVIIPGGSTWDGSFVTGNNRVTLNSGVSIAFDAAGGFDLELARGGTSYDTANLDIRAANGLRVRNRANSADAALTAGAITASGLVRTPAGDYFNAGLEIGSNLGMYDSSGLVVRHGGQECVQVNGSELSMRSSVVIGWTGTTAATGTIEAGIAYNGGNTIDVRANTGLRLRNLANSAWSTLQAGTITANSDLNVWGSALSVGTSSAFAWSGRTRILSPSDGKLQITNSAGTSGVQLDFATNGQMSLRDRTDAGPGNLNVGSITASGRFTSTSDFDVLVPSVASARESIFRARVSDSGNDAFHIYNATAFDGGFAAGFSGSRFSSNLLAMGFIAQTDAANDTGSTPLMIFESRRTDNQTDPNNGTLSAITTRPLFGWQTFGAEYMRMSATGNLILNSTIDNGSKLQVNGSVTSGAITASGEIRGAGRVTSGVAPGLGSGFYITSNGVDVGSISCGDAALIIRGLEGNGNRYRAASHNFQSSDGSAWASIGALNGTFFGTGSFSGTLTAANGINVGNNLGPNSAANGLRFSDGFNGDRLRLISRFATISGGNDQLKFNPDVGIVWGSEIATNSQDIWINRESSGILRLLVAGSVKIQNLAASTWMPIQAGSITANNNLTITNTGTHASATINAPAGFSAFTSYSSNGGGFQTTFGLTGTSGAIFNNTSAGDFAIRSPQSRGIHFGADNGLGNATSTMLLASNGNLGIGQSNPNVGLVIRRSGTDLPSMRLEDGDITIPMTGLSINPSLNANTVSAWSASGSATGGAQMNGFTNNTASAIPMSILGYSGSTTPTAPCIGFTGNKSNGGTGVADLTGSELIAGFYAGNGAVSPVVTIAANGAVTAPSMHLAGTSNNIGVECDADGVRLKAYSGSALMYVTTTGGGVRIAGSREFGWVSDANSANGGTFDTKLVRDASDTVAQRNGTTAQTFRVYRTFTDASNYTRFFVNTNASGSKIAFGTERAGTGPSPGVDFIVNGTKMLDFNAGAVDIYMTGRSLTWGTANSGEVRLKQFSAFSSRLNVVDAASDSNHSDIGLRRVIYGGNPSTTTCMIKNTSGTMNLRLGDDSADCDITAARGFFSGAITHGFQSLAANPTISDIASNSARLVKNTTNGEVRLWVNDGGTMKSVLLS